MLRVILIHQHDPGGPHVGGIGTFLNTFLKYAPSDFDLSLIGVTTDPQSRPVGRWQRLTAGGREYRFLPVIAARPNYRGLVPVTLRLAAGVRRFRREIDFGNAVVELHRIEPAMALAGVLNPRVLFLHAHSEDIYNPKTENIWRRFPWAYFWLERRLIGRMRRVFVVREDAVEAYRRSYPAIADRIQFLPTWVDGEVFVSLPESERARGKAELAARHGLDPSRRWLLFVGRFEGQKDPLRLLEAFRSMNGDGTGLDLVMIGEGLLGGKMREFIASRGIGSRVHLIGPQPQGDLARWMNSADCLVLSSAYEGMPRVIVEALQCGLPVVSTAVGEAPRLIGEGAGGRLVRDPSAQAFSAAVRDLLQRPPSRESCRGQVSRFTAREVLEPVYAAYRRIQEERGAAEHPDQVHLFGIRLDNLSMAETLERVRGFLRGSGRHYVVTPNVDHVVRLQRDPEFRQIYLRASLVVADGMPLIWASRLLGKPLKDRVTGTDLLRPVCRIAAEEGASVFFLGGNPGVAEKAAENLSRELPGLRVAGTSAPPFGFEYDPEEDRRVVEAIQRSKADILFVCLGAPKQERWIARHLEELPVKAAFCVGSALDYPAGAARRAPLWMRKGGLEWVWRILLEPRRLARRYLIEDAAFFGIFLREWRRSHG